MTQNLIVGAAVIGLTVLIHTVGLLGLSRFALGFRERFRMHRQPHRVLLMVLIVLGLFAIIAVEIWAWAICYAVLGTSPDFPTALYLATVTFSTVGYGDVVPHPDWQLLAALEGVSGFLVIGWSTAYLVTAGVTVGPFRSGEHF